MSINGKEPEHDSQTDEWEEDSIPTGIKHLPAGPAQLWAHGVHRDLAVLKALPKRLNTMEQLLGNILFSLRIGIPALAAVVLGGYWLITHLSLK